MSEDFKPSLPMRIANKIGFIGMISIFGAAVVVVVSWGIGFTIFYVVVKFIVAH